MVLLVAIAFKSINNTRAEFFGKYIFKKKLVNLFSCKFEKKINLQYGNVFSVEFSRRFLISRDYLQKWESTK